MADEKQSSAEFDPKEVLARLDGTSSAMVDSTEAPRSLRFVFIALIATVVALLNVVSWPALLALSTLGIPLGL